MPTIGETIPFTIGEGIPTPEPERPPLNPPPDFEAALTDLQDHLPYWWESRNSEAALYSLLYIFGTQIDALAWLFEWPFLNSVLDTANEEGLLRNFAFAYGLEDEQLPPTAERLRPYIQACAEMDGSLAGLLRVLMAVIGANAAVNTTGGTVLRFPEMVSTLEPIVTEEAGGELGPGLYYYVVTAIIEGRETLVSNERSFDASATNKWKATLKWSAATGATGYRIYRGREKSEENTMHEVGAVTEYVDKGPGFMAAVPPGGLVFPSNGSGLTLYQFAPGEGPKAGLTFPANGEGLHFPILPSLLPSDNMIGATGETPPGAGPGLTFSQNEYLLVSQGPGEYEWMIEVLNWLTFDRNAFRRAVERYANADFYPAVIQEVSALA